MIDVNQAKVKEVLKLFDVNSDRFKKQANTADLLLLSRLIAVLYENPDSPPRECADKLNKLYGYDLDGNAVITLFKKKSLGNPVERAAAIRWADNVALLFSKAIIGDKESYDNFQNEHRKKIINVDGKHNPQNYIAANVIFLKYPELNIYGSAEVLHNLDILLGKYYFFDLADAVGEVYGFETNKQNKKHETSQNIKLSLEQAKVKITQLENRLDMSDSMLQDLQDDFNEQLESVKTQELTEFFSSLNSEKYGYILDELLLLRKGVDELRAKNYEVPLEINGVLILVKKMIQFVRDSHINPMMRINEIKQVKASDLEYCNYDGSPFTSKDEIKKVQVVSPGWLYKDKDIQISRPKLKEVDSNE